MRVSVLYPSGIRLVSVLCPSCVRRTSTWCLSTPAHISYLAKGSKEMPRDNMQRIRIPCCVTNPNLDHHAHDTMACKTQWSRRASRGCFFGPMRPFSCNCNQVTAQKNFSPKPPHPNLPPCNTRNTCTTVRATQPHSTYSVHRTASLSERVKFLGLLYAPKYLSYTFPAP